MMSKQRNQKSTSRRANRWPSFALCYASGLILFLILSPTAHSQNPTINPPSSPPSNPTSSFSSAPPNQGSPPASPPASTPTAQPNSPPASSPPSGPPSGLPDLPPLPMPPTVDEVVEVPAAVPKRPGNRDPFAKPKSLLDREADATKPVIDPAVYIDARIEPIRRFPLRNYVLVGIIFDVENPKAMIKDPDGNMHMVSKSQRIGNQEGVIQTIERGEVKVEEKGKQVSIRLLKSN